MGKKRFWVLRVLMFCNVFACFLFLVFVVVWVGNNGSSVKIGVCCLKQRGLSIVPCAMAKLKRRRKKEEPVMS